MKLRIDPWGVDYESAYQIEGEADADVQVDQFVEMEEWRAVEPAPVARPDVVVFVDGVQRTEVRVLGEREGGVVYGAFASLAVGAVLARPKDARIVSGRPLRVLALGDGAETESASVHCGSLTLTFETASTAETGPGAVRGVLDVQRRDAETRLGQEMVEQGHPLVIVDGRLSFQPTRRSMAVGLIKTLHRQYLEGPRAALLADLPTGTRTPLFRIARDRPAYSWYLRLCERRPIEHAWAGLVRLETLEGIGLEGARQLADLTALHVPPFASTAAWDPRAPQNLYPISALEQQLRHELGDPEWLRRAIETHLQREVAS